MNNEQKAVEARFFAEVRANLDDYVTQYQLRFGNFITTDNAREFSTDYNQSNETRARYAAAVQEPASLIVRAVYARILQQPDPQKENSVVFLAGGGGSGKNTSLANLSAMLEIREEAQLVYETIMSNFDSSIRKIYAALDADQAVTILYIHRPIEGAALGVLDRAAAEGRTYPIEPLSEGHFHAQRTILKLAEHYQLNPLVSTYIIDNSGGIGQARFADLDFLRQNLYNSVEAVTQRARAAIDHGYRNQSQRGVVIPEPVYRALVGGENQQSQAAVQEVRGAIGTGSEQRGTSREAQPVSADGSSSSPPNQVDSAAEAETRAPDTAEIFVIASAILDYSGSDTYDGAQYRVDRSAAGELTVTAKDERGVILRGDLPSGPFVILKLTLEDEQNFRQAQLRLERLQSSQSVDRGGYE